MLNDTLVFQYSYIPTFYDEMWDSPLTRSFIFNIRRHYQLNTLIASQGHLLCLLLPRWLV